MADVTRVPLPLVEPVESRDATTMADSKVLNGIIEKSTRGTLRVVKRPGQKAVYQATVGTGQGITNYLNNLYAISGDTLSAFGSATAFQAIQATSAAAFTPRTGHFAVGFLGKLWTMGGFDSSGNPLNDVWNSVDGINWSQVTTAAPWGARGAGQSIVFNNTLYIMGGGSSTTTADWGDVWSTPDGVNWTMLTSGAWPNRKRFGLCASGNLMYVAGGTATLSSGSLYPDTYYSDVYSSPDGINWTQLTSNAPWVARANFGFFWLGSRLHVVGGLLTDPFALATGDLWSSADGITWVRDSSNPFSVSNSAVWPIAAFNSYGSEFPIPAPVTVTGGSGGVAAWSFTDFDDDVPDDDSSLGNYAQVTFSNVGSGMSQAPTLTPGVDTGFNTFPYAFLDGTSNGGAKQLRTAVIGNTVYLLEFVASGTYVERIWSTTDGLNFTNTATNFSAGWAVRSGEFFAQGNLWMIGGMDGTPTFYNDVWFISANGTNTALSPNVAGGFYHFNQTSTAITTPLLVFKSTKDLYSYNASINTLTKLSNVANYPATTVPGLVYLDTVFYVMDPKGQIWGSAPNDPSTYTALNVVAMQNEPNGGVAIAKLSTYVVGFGVWTIEFFYDGGSNAPPPGSALLPNTTLPLNVGCANGESVVEMQNSIVWIGQTRREGQGIYMFNNYEPQRISNPFIDRILQNDPLTNVTAITVDSFGHSLYILTLHTSGITMVYSFDSQLWTLWTSMIANTSKSVTSLTCDAYGTATAVIPSNSFPDGDPVTITGASPFAYNGTYNITVVDSNTFTFQVGSNLGAGSGAQATNYSSGPFRPVASAQVLDTDYMQDPVNGIIYSQDITDVTDSGNPIDLTIVTARYDGGTTVWKYCKRITLVADTEVYNAVLQYSDNDYVSYSAARILATGVGQRATVPQAGRFRRRAFKIRHTLPVQFRAESLELEIILGAF